MLAARAVVICPAPFGAGNVALLEAALEVARAEVGPRVLLLEPDAPEVGVEAEASPLERVRGRDFAGGRAVAAYAALLAAGARVVASPAALVAALREEG
jgi:hypothetical protein